ncbi:hypothetical protein SAMN05720354_1266 [Nitrosospira sp. Nsp1]|nr:hypothetical protein SAMN05720354_1266 [Nitrosospira sp. Nsp1]
MSRSRSRCVGRLHLASVSTFLRKGTARSHSAPLRPALHPKNRALHPSNCWIQDDCFSTNNRAENLFHGGLRSRFVLGRPINYLRGEPVSGPAECRDDFRYFPALYGFDDLKAARGYDAVSSGLHQRCV